MKSVAEQLAAIAAKPHLVALVYAGGPRDGDVVPVARALLSKRTPTWVRCKTRQAIHVYKARVAWKGEPTVTLYHRGAYRVHGA